MSVQPLLLFIFPIRTLPLVCHYFLELDATLSIRIQKEILLKIVFLIQRKEFYDFCPSTTLYWQKIRQLCDIYVGLFGRYAFRCGSRVYYIYFLFSFLCCIGVALLIVLQVAIFFFRMEDFFRQPRKKVGKIITTCLEERHKDFEPSIQLRESFLCQFEIQINQYNFIYLKRSIRPFRFKSELFIVLPRKLKKIR